MMRMKMRVEDAVQEYSRGGRLVEVILESTQYLYKFEEAFDEAMAR